MVKKRVKEALETFYGEGSSQARDAIKDFERIERLIRTAKKMVPIKVEST